MEFQHELVIPDEGLPFKFFLFEGSQGNYVREKHSLFIGEDAAENIKIKIGTASEEADLRTMEVKGRNIIRRKEYESSVDL